MQTQPTAQLTALPAWPMASTNTRSPAQRTAAIPTILGARPGPDSWQPPTGSPELELKPHTNYKVPSQRPDSSPPYVPSWPSAPASNRRAVAGTDDGDAPLLALSSFLEKLPRKTPSPTSTASDLPSSSWSNSKGSSGTSSSKPTGPPCSAPGTMPLEQVLEEDPHEEELQEQPQELGTARHGSGIITSTGSDTYRGQRTAYSASVNVVQPLSGARYSAGGSSSGPQGGSSRPVSNRYMGVSYSGSHAMTTRAGAYNQHTHSGYLNFDGSSSAGRHSLQMEAARYSGSYAMPASGRASIQTNAGYVNPYFRPHPARASMPTNGWYSGSHAMPGPNRILGRPTKGMVKSLSAASLSDQDHEDDQQGGYLGDMNRASNAAANAELFSIKQKLQQWQEEWAKAKSDAAANARPAATGSHGRVGNSQHVSTDAVTGRALLPAWPQPAPPRAQKPSPYSPPQAPPLPLSPQTPSTPSPDTLPRSKWALPPAKTASVHQQQQMGRTTSTDIGSSPAKGAPPALQVGMQRVSSVSRSPQGSVNGAWSNSQWNMSWSGAPLGDTDSMALSEQLTNPSEIETLEVHASNMSGMSTTPMPSPASASSGELPQPQWQQQQQQRQAMKHLHKQLARWQTENGHPSNATMAGNVAFGSTQSLMVGETKPYPYTLEPRKVWDTAHHTSPWQLPQQGRMSSGGTAMGPGDQPPGHTQSHKSRHSMSTTNGYHMQSQHRRRSMSQKAESGAQVLTRTQQAPSRRSIQLATRGAPVSWPHPEDVKRQIAAAADLGRTAADEVQGRGADGTQDGPKATPFKQTSQGSGTQPVDAVTAGAIAPASAVSPRQRDSAKPGFQLSSWLLVILIATILLLLLLNATLLTMAARTMKDPSKP